MRITDVSRRNRVYLVHVDGDCCLVLKLARRAGDVGVAHEAAVLARLGRADGSPPVAPWLPPVVGYDEQCGVLVLKATRASQSLSLVHAGGRFPLTLAAPVGCALARVHAQPDSALAGLDELDRLLADWHTECVIHGDVRWDNCLVAREAPPGRRRGLVMID